MNRFELDEPVRDRGYGDCEQPRVARRSEPDSRLQLYALAYNLGFFLSYLGLPEPLADWSLTSLLLKLIKIDARVVRHARAILAAIHRLRAPPS